MPGHSVEEPAHRRPLCAQVMCSHASFISEPTAWTGTPLLHLHHADATVKHCAAVMGCRSAMLPVRPSPTLCPVTRDESSSLSYQTRHDSLPVCAQAVVFYLIV